MKSREAVTNSLNSFSTTAAVRPSAWPSVRLMTVSLSGLMNSLQQHAEGRDGAAISSLVMEPYGGAAAAGGEH